MDIHTYIQHNAKGRQQKTLQDIPTLLRQIKKAQVERWANTSWWNSKKDYKKDEETTQVPSGNDPKSKWKVTKLHKLGSEEIDKNKLKN